MSVCVLAPPNSLPHLLFENKHVLQRRGKIISLPFSLPPFLHFFASDSLPFRLGAYLLSSLPLFSLPSLMIMMGAVNECCSSGSKSLIKEYYFFCSSASLVCCSTECHQRGWCVRHANGQRECDGHIFMHGR